MYERVMGSPGQVQRPLQNWGKTTFIHARRLRSLSHHSPGREDSSKRSTCNAAAFRAVPLVRPGVLCEFAEHTSAAVPAEDGHDGRALPRLRARDPPRSAQRAHVHAVQGGATEDGSVTAAEPSNEAVDSSQHREPHANQWQAPTEQPLIEKSPTDRACWQQLRPVERLELLLTLVHGRERLDSCAGGADDDRRGRFGRSRAVRPLRS